jgi:hypothetical protein
MRKDLVEQPKEKDEDQYTSDGGGSHAERSDRVTKRGKKD